MGDDVSRWPGSKDDNDDGSNELLWRRSEIEYDAGSGAKVLSISTRSACDDDMDDSIFPVDVAS